MNTTTIKALKDFMFFVSIFDLQSTTIQTTEVVRLWFTEVAGTLNQEDTTAQVSTATILRQGGRKKWSFAEARQGSKNRRAYCGFTIWIHKRFWRNRQP